MCITLSHNHSGTLTWHYLVEEKQREMAADQLLIGGEWEREAGRGPAEHTAFWGDDWKTEKEKDENIEERAKKQWTKPLVNVWNHSITHAKILPVQLWKAAQSIRRAVLYLIMKSREILQTLAFCFPFFKIYRRPPRKLLFIHSL